MTAADLVAQLWAQCRRDPALAERAVSALPWDIVARLAVAEERMAGKLDRPPAPRPRWLTVAELDGGTEPREGDMLEQRDGTWTSFRPERETAAA